MRRGPFCAVPKKSLSPALFCTRGPFYRRVRVAAVAAAIAIAAATPKAAPKGDHGWNRLRDAPSPAAAEGAFYLLNTAMAITFCLLQRIVRFCRERRMF